jgi:hypothetical protein
MCNGVQTKDLLVIGPTCYRLTQRLSGTAYKYIIVTALLVKSQCGKVHGLCLVVY